MAPSYGALSCLSRRKDKDRLTLGGGFVLNPTFRDGQVLLFTPKFTFPTQSKVTFSVGAIGVGIFNRRYEFDFQSGVSRKGGIETNIAGIGYGMLTIGDTERNGSVGLGEYFNDELGDSPITNISYMSRVGRKIGFITENWLVIPPQGGNFVAVTSGGVRFFGEKIAVDLAWLVPVAEPPLHCPTLRGLCDKVWAEEKKEVSAAESKFGGRRLLNKKVFLISYPKVQVAKYPDTKYPEASRLFREGMSGGHPLFFIDFCLSIIAALKIYFYL